MKMNFLVLAMVFIPILMGFLPIALKNTKKLNLTVVGLCIAELFAALYLMLNAHTFEGQIVNLEWFSGVGLHFEINGLGVLLAVATCIIWVASSVFSNEYFDHAPQNLGRYYGFFCVTFGATLGIFLAQDLFTVFVFFETMSFASYALVAHNQDKDSIAAGNSYLTIAVLGGLVVLMGIFLLNSLTGTLIISQLQAACAQVENTGALVAAGFMIFFGFAAKAGMFPLHGWLPQAHPAAPAPASAVLSGILIKAGVYGIIVVTLKILAGNYGWAILMLVLGVCTMLIGAVFAFFSINLKETLAYSSMSQIGFIIIGVAMASVLGSHGTIASYGTVLHMINHTLIKLVLFTGAGIVYQNTHSLNLNTVQGWGKDKPFLKLCFGIAALGIMGVPGFNGFISKTLLHESIVEKIWLFESYTLQARMFQLVEGLFLLSGGFTVAYMTKLFICIFVKKPTQAQHAQKTYVSMRTKVVLGMASALIIILGLLPYITADKIAASTAHFMGVHPLEESVNYFSFVNIKGALISIAIGMLLYFVVARNTIITKEKEYINPWKKTWTIENLVYRPVLFEILPFIFGFFSRILDVIMDVIVFVINRLLCKSVAVPQTFLVGKQVSEEEKQRRSSSVSITRSLAYSLLLFGLGFVITMLYLLVAEFRV